MEHEAIIYHIYDAFNRRDVDAVFIYFQPDVVWPNGWEGGYVHGLNEVREYWTRQWNEINPLVTPVKITITSDSIVEVDVKQLVKNLNGDVLADGMVKHTYTFADGLVRRMDISGL